MALREKIFASVFPAPSEVGIPTPAATPVLGSSAFGESFGPLSSSIGTGAAEQIKWDRAWHTATDYLTLIDEPINANQDERTLKAKWIKPCPPQTQAAIQYILSDDSWGRRLRKDKDDLLRWYFEEVILGHYVEHVLPDLSKVFDQIGEGRCPILLICSRTSKQ